MKCRHCRIGQYYHITAPFLHWLGGQVMVLPDAPARTCDVCGHMEFEEGFLHRIEFFIDRLDRNKTAVAASPAQITLDDHAGWHASRRSR